MSADAITCEGTVVDAARGDIYSVDVELGGQRRRVLAKRSGRLVSRHIKILPGDTVTLELGIYDMSRGRIVFRGRMQEPAT